MFGGLALKKGNMEKDNKAFHILGAIFVKDLR